MIEGTIAIRYARALIDLARKDNNIDSFAHELKAFLELEKISKVLFYTLNNKGFSAIKRITVLENVVSKTNMSKTVLNFLKILIQKSRIELLPLIYATYCTMADKEQNRCNMTVESAVELPDDQYNSLADHFGKTFDKKIVLTKKINSGVLGGVKVQIGNKIYDNTIRKQIEDIRQRAQG